MKPADQHQRTSISPKHTLNKLTSSKYRQTAKQIRDRNKRHQVTTPMAVEKQAAKPIPKLKLQLFPKDDATLEGLQKEKYIPYLELTLSTRKKISSVVKHVSDKWANSKIAVGELMLFPFEAQPENVAVHKRWSAKDAGVSAGAVYMEVGSPAVFRLRYGWFTNVEPRDGEGKQCLSATNEQELVSPHGLLKSKEVAKKEPTNVEKHNDASVLFPDNLTNISFGDLLSAFPLNSTSQQNGLLGSSGTHLSKFPFSCDSFDAAIASHLARYQTLNESVQAPSTSLWDAEETCHAFSFQKNNSSAKRLIGSTWHCNTSSNNNISEKCQDLAKSCDQVESIDQQDNQVGVESTECDISKKTITELGVRTLEQDRHHRCSPSRAQVPKSSESSLGFAGINWDSMAPLEAGMTIKQINYDENVNFSGLFGNSRDSSRSCSALKTR